MPSGPNGPLGEWIANDRQMRRIIEQMRNVAAKAADLRLAQTSQQPAKV